MEGIGSEVSQKIRAAIKAKLIELGAYVDDELPDYIMVMVANKRTKSQMDEDLQLFLTSNTKVFTSWLHTVLQKLQEVTIANFENKKDLEEKKTAKLKKSEISYKSKSRKSSEENLGRIKKHGKKHKDSKKTKKNKHKSKEKTKLKLGKKEKNENREKLEKREDNSNVNLVSDETVKKIDPEEVLKKNLLALKEEEEKTMADKLKKNKILHQDRENIFSGGSSSKNSSDLSNKSGLEKDISSVKADIGIKTSVIEDEFNIEPLKPNEKCNELDFQSEYLTKSPSHIEPSSAEVEVEKTISAPTEELLKEHNKIQNQKLEEEKNEHRKLESDSEDSISPEEMRKQLLLSRAKKKLEHCKIADRMRSNSPDVLILEENNRTVDKDKDFCPSSRFDSYKQTDFQSSKSFPSRSGNLSKNSSAKKSPNRTRLSPSSYSSDIRKSKSPKKLISSTKTNKNDKSKLNMQKTSNNEEMKIAAFNKFDKENEKKKVFDSTEKKKHVIKISESLEMEKNLGIKKEEDSSKTNQKDNSYKKKSVLSRVVTITAPEAPEISSIVKVKPREFISKDKQANKTLILKAVAEAQKSIATVPSRPEPEKETKKESLFTKNLRQKHFEKLAVTLSNIRKSPNSRERRISVDSDKNDKSRNNFDGLETAEGDKSKSSKKISKSEDQFISSKTTIMEKNDKYIRCWLEGVQQAVIDEEMVNPQELEDLIIHSNVTEEVDTEIMEEETANECKKRKWQNLEDAGDKMSKNAKLSDKEIANLRVIPTSTAKDDGPQIVVTLDGLDTKTIKDIILRNKEARNGPILSSAIKSNENEKVTKAIQKISSSSKEKSPTDSRKLGFQKISDRFARLNKSREDSDLEREKNELKFSRHQSSETDKEKRSKVSTESKNRLLIAQLSEKFGKVDREFENKKRKYPEEDRRCIYGSRKMEKEDIERNGKYRKLEKRSGRKDSLSPPSKFPSSVSSQFCKFYPNCKNLDCFYFHPKKCRFDEDCKNPDCKYVHSENHTRRSKWYSKS